MTKLFDWDAQLAVGKRGEALLLKHHPALVPSDDRRWDLYDTSPASGSYLKVEVKTDTYDPAKRPNFFCERRTRSAGRQGGPDVLKDGGPWRSLAHGVDRFCYLFISAKPPVAYWFDDVPKLVAALDALAPGLPQRAVHNQGIRAEGYLVRRELLKDLYREVRYPA